MTIDEADFRRILDEVLDSKLEQKLEEKLELKFAEGLGQMTKHFDARFDKFEHKINKKIDGIYVLLSKDGDRIDNDESERAAINQQLDRHEEWINELATNTGTNLSAS